MLLYNTETGKTTYFVELDGNSNQPIVIDLTYVQATTPNNPQENDTWFDTTNNVIKIYKDGQWTKTGDPSVGVFYFYNNEYYLWDGNSLEKTDLNIYEKVENKSTNIDPTTANNITYPTTQAVVNYVTTKSFVKNFIDADITQTSGTMVQLAQDIQSKHLETGTIVYGEITCSDMPFQGNAEVRVEVLETKGAPNYYQVLEFTLFSTTDAPYQWSFMYYQPQFTTWTWVPKVIIPDQTNNNGKFLTTNGSTMSWQSIVSETIEIDSANPTISPIAGKTYNCITTLESLTLTSIPISNDDIAIYFTTDSSTPFTLTATQLEGKWWNINSPTFDKNSEYVICIVNGNAVMAKIGE